MGGGAGEEPRELWGLGILLPCPSTGQAGHGQGTASEGESLVPALSDTRTVRMSVEWPRELEGPSAGKTWDWEGAGGRVKTLPSLRRAEMEGWSCPGPAPTAGQYA